MVEIDQKLADFDVNDPVNGIDLECLGGEMVNTTAYKTLVEYIFPLKRYVSMAAIFNERVFLKSIGQAIDDGYGLDETESPRDCVIHLRNESSRKRRKRMGFSYKRWRCL